MDLTIESVCNINALPQKHIICVEEQQFIDGTFVISSILETRIKRGDHIVFVLFHQTFGHYHGIGTKLGYNLMNYKQKGKVEIIDCLSELFDNNSNEMEGKNERWPGVKLNAIFVKIKKATEKFQQEGNVTVVLEHPANIIMAGGNVTSVMLFGVQMRSLVRDGVSLCCLTKTLPDCADLAAFANSFHHYSDLSVQVKGLTTGSAADINGSIVVLRKKIDEPWDQTNCYHFLLLDKRIKLFAPGFVQIR